VWKQGTTKSQGLGVQLVTLPKHIKPYNYPGLHLLISGANKPYYEAYPVGFGFCSRALECLNGKKNLTSDC
jgi:hypothetical protein